MKGWFSKGLVFKRAGFKRALFKGWVQGLGLRAGIKGWLKGLGLRAVCFRAGYMGLG